MRITNILVAVVGVLALGAGIVAGGRHLDESQSSESIIEAIEDIPLDVTDMIDEEADAQATVKSIAAAPQPVEAVAVAPADSPAVPTRVAATSVVLAPPVPTTVPAAPVVAEPAPVNSVNSRRVSPDLIAPPEVDLNGLERIEPREPLSQLALALPPKPELPQDWDGTVLYRPVATESARFQAMGYTVAIAGTESVGADESCTFEGKSWNCGVRARTAFRLFLRGRSPTCAVPPEADRTAILANCRIGKQDIGNWLVENGWARAVAGSPYEEAGEKAKTARRGIFGAPPSALPPSAKQTVTVAPTEIVSPIDPLAPFE